MREAKIGRGLALIMLRLPRLIFGAFYSSLGGYAVPWIIHLSVPGLVYNIYVNRKFKKMYERYCDDR